jgi:UDP-glucose 4-epimerase
VFGDGLQTRDYVYVGDVVSANLLAASSDAVGAFNIGTGVQSTVRDIAEALDRLSSNGFSVEEKPERPGEVRHIYLDTTRAQEELGWKAAVGLGQGLETTLDSLR